MILRELLETLSKDEPIKLKLGAESGTGWIYAGTAGDFLKNPYYKNDILIEDAKRKSLMAMEQLRKKARQMPTETSWKKSKTPPTSYSVALAEWGRKLSRETMRTAAMVECFENYVPLIEREVKEYFPSFAEKATNIVVRGMDSGDTSILSVAKMKPLSAEAMSNEGAERLVAAIYAEETDRLKEIYRRIYKCYARKTKPSKDDLRAAKFHEGWIRKDVYAILKEPNSIIKSCREAVRMELEDEKAKE